MLFHRPSGGEVGGKVGRPCSESLDPPHLRADKSVRSFLFFFFLHLPCITAAVPVAGNNHAGLAVLLACVVRVFTLRPAR